MHRKFSETIYINLHKCNVSKSNGGIFMSTYELKQVFFAYDNWIDHNCFKINTISLKHTWTLIYCMTQYQIYIIWIKKCDINRFTIMDIKYQWNHFNRIMSHLHKWRIIQVLCYGVSRFVFLHCFCSNITCLPVVVPVSRFPCDAWLKC